MNIISDDVMTACNRKSVSVKVNEAEPSTSP